MKKIVLVAVLSLLLMNFALANDPVAVLGIQRGSDTRADLSTEGETTNAKAGNVTSLIINFTGITETWQGYYGNITGKIVLDNADNKSMYDWTVNSPTGNIFAVNESISDWSSVDCFNFTASSPELNLSSLESALGLDSSDADGVDETFNTTTHATVYVGTNSFTNQCPATKLYVDDGSSTSFDNVLLYDPTTKNVIYTAVIYQDSTGFSNTNVDFQIIVGENGHGSAAGTKTPYYFYFQLA